MGEGRSVRERDAIEDLSVPGCPESLPDLYSGCPKERETYGGFRGGRDRGSVRTPDDRGRDLRFDK